MDIDVIGQFSQYVRSIPDASEGNITPVAEPSSKGFGFVAVIQVHAFRAWRFVANLAVDGLWSCRSHSVSPSTQVILFSLLILGSPAFVLLQISLSMDKISSSIALLLTKLAVWISSVFARSIPIELIARFYLPASGASFHEVN
jgi:hypothetical protein